MNISIFGLGYVGAVSAACLANRGHSVWGVDINQDKVNIINSGRSPIIEPDLEELTKQAIASSRLKATTDHKTALQNSDISLVAVATPSKSSGQIDPAHLLRACEQIAQGLLTLNKKQLVVIRSSVLPSVFRECNSVFQKIAPGLVELCANPEFLREGSAIKDFDNPPYTVIGTLNTDAEKVLRALYADIPAQIFVLSPEEAIMIKYASNVYHGLKVAFANEIGIVCKAQGINAANVMKVFTQDTKLNASARYLMPGFAFGGSCLPKDIRAVAYVARTLDVQLPMISSILSSNDYLIETMSKKILRYKKRKVGLIGLSFKSNTDDLRESPFVELAERLLGKGIHLKIYDPNVSLARLVGANKAYIEEAIPHISSLLVSTVAEIAEHSEIIVVGHNFSEISQLQQLVKPETVVLDLFNIPSLRSNKGSYDGIAW